MPGLNETHDPALKSWIDSANVSSANDGATDFPIQNLPFGVFRRKGSKEAFRPGVAIGDRILDLPLARASGAFAGEPQALLGSLEGETLNDFMARGDAAWSALRLALSRALREGSAAEAKLRGCLSAQAEAEYAVPARIGDYTDFYASIHHATTMGKLFRPDNPLLPNYKWVPIAYHGRASSIGVTGQTFPRPKGQLKAPDAAAPVFAPCKRLDYELEMAAFIGPGNAQGSSVPLAQAESRLFGLVILNDWSARDIQTWEYQPLGPLLAKNFASTISPWVVTLEALEPFRVAWTRDAADPQPLPYLESAENRARGGFDVQLEVWLRTAKMNSPARLMRSNFRHCYWTLAQMVTHHTSNGCNLMPGDLLGTGTQSGPGAGEGGSILELSGGGKTPVELPGGEKRSFIEDGDTVIMRAFCEKPGHARIGFGECAGTVLPAAV